MYLINFKLVDKLEYDNPSATLLMVQNNLLLLSHCALELFIWKHY